MMPRQSALLPLGYLKNSKNSVLLLESQPQIYRPCPLAYSIPLFTCPPSSRSQRCCRYASSSSAASARWKQRQGRDPYSREARNQGLKSRAAFKLVEMNKKHRIFRPGQTVVDLGFAPGSWSQVAQAQTRPGGRIVGIDLLPAQPPDGVFSIQGDFLDPEVHQQVKRWLVGQRAKKHGLNNREQMVKMEMEKMKAMKEKQNLKSSDHEVDAGTEANIEAQDIIAASPGLGDAGTAMDTAPEQEQDQHEKEQEHKFRTICTENHDDSPKPLDTSREKKAPAGHGHTPAVYPQTTRDGIRAQREDTDMRIVDVVLSDMLMNTSGIPFKDHAESMDLCLTALKFAAETLKPGGKFVCKFYQGSEDKELEQALKNVFEKVFREKPDSSRKESREAYFVALNRKQTSQ